MILVDCCCHKRISNVGNIFMDLKYNVIGSSIINDIQSLSFPRKCYNYNIL